MFYKETKYAFILLRALRNINWCGEEEKHRRKKDKRMWRKTQKHCRKKYKLMWREIQKHCRKKYKWMWTFLSAGGRWGMDGCRYQPQNKHERKNPLRQVFRTTVKPIIESRISMMLRSKIYINTYFCDTSMIHAYILEHPLAWSH